jgi:hypothetical protein
MVAKLQTTKIAHNNGTDAMTIDTAGKVTFNADKVYNANEVVQIVRNYKADPGVQNVTSTSFAEVNSDFRLSITPRYASSLIFVDMHVSMVDHSGASWIRGKMYVKVGTGSFAAMPSADNYHLGYQSSAARYAPWTFGGVYDPSDLSELTFSPYAQVNSSTGRFVHDAGSYSITLTEVAQ